MNMKTLHLPSLLLLLLALGLCLGLNSCTNDLPDPEQLLDPNPDANPDGALRPEDYVGQPVSFSGFTVTEVSTDAATRAVTGSKSEAFGKQGEVVTIKMEVKRTHPDGTQTKFSYLADYVLSPDGTWVPAPQNKPLCWQDVNYTHHFTAYYPALTEQEKKDKKRTSISLPLIWTEDNYREYSHLMQSPQTEFPIGSPVSLNLWLLLTRIEVSIDPATGITDATHLTMYTKTEGKIEWDDKLSPDGDANIPVREMNLWRSPSPTDANPVFLGYAIPQTYAPGTLLLKHHTPDVNDARSYTVDVNPNFPDGLTTKGGEVVSFTVAAILPTEVHVKAAGGLQAALNDAFPKGDYPTRLKIIGELNGTDILYLVTLTDPAAVGGNITAVDMEEALAAENAFVFANGHGLFINYKGSIKNLVLPSSLSTVPYAAFAGSTLTSVTLPKELKEIDDGAFMNCKDLKSITLPSSVTTLGAQAFYASGLTSIELPEALTEVGYAAFQDCADLQQVALPGNKTINVGADAFLDIHPSCHLFLYAPGLDADTPVVQEYLTGNWGGTTWENVHWGYKGSGSKLNPDNYEHHLKVMP